MQLFFLISVSSSPSISSSISSESSVASSSPGSFTPVRSSNESEALQRSTKSSNQSTPEQDELSDKINLENEILVVLFKKKELNQLTENDRVEIAKCKKNVEKLKKKLRELKLNRQRSQKYRNERKRKLDALDETTR